VCRRLCFTAEGLRSRVVDARRQLHDIGSAVSSDFVKNRSILSFEEYMQLFLASPGQQLRNAAQYLVDAIDFFGAE
jgi:serine protein kinase